MTRTYDLYLTQSMPSLASPPSHVATRVSCLGRFFQLAIEKR